MQIAAPAEQIDLAVRNVLSRPPDDEERRILVEYLTERTDRPDEACRQLVWALVDLCRVPIQPLIVDRISGNPEPPERNPWPRPVARPSAARPNTPSNRRGFLGTMAVGAAAFAADMTALNVLRSPALAAELKRKQKHVILLWLAGGSSQLETWDPKPGAPTGGPFRSIPTSVPGIHISELMPEMAARMDHTCIIRSLNTKNGDHGGGARLMMQGRRDDPSVRYPDMGAVLARELGQAHSRVPDYVTFYSPTEGRGMAPGTTRLPRRALRPDVADHRHDRPRTSAASTRSTSSITSSAPSSATS